MEISDRQTRWDRRNKNAGLLHQALESRRGDPSRQFVVEQYQRRHAEDVHTALENAVEPGLDKVQDFDLRYIEYTDKYKHDILGVSRIVSGSAQVELAHDTLMLAAQFEEVEIIRSVLEAWAGGPRWKAYAVLEAGDFTFLTECIGGGLNRPPISPKSVHKSHLRTKAYARYASATPKHYRAIPKWLRSSLGLLKLVPVGAYVGKRGLHVAKDLFLVTHRMRKKGEPL